MTTYVVMQTRIADDLVRDDLQAQIKVAINDAIKLWEGERFAGINEKRYQILTVDGQEWYDLATPTLLTSAGAAVGTGETMLEVDLITCLTTSGNLPYKLTPRTMGWFAENQGTTQNDPTGYGFFGDQLRLYPISGSNVATLNLMGLGRLNTLAVDADTNAWMVEGERLIRNQAKLLLYRDLVRDAEGASLAEAAMNDAEARLRRKSSARFNTGGVTPWTL